MSEDNSSIARFETLKPSDLCEGESQSNADIRQTRETSRIRALAAENQILRHHLLVLQENRCLRSASIVGTLLTWIDNDTNCISRDDNCEIPQLTQGHEIERNIRKEDNTTLKTDKAQYYNNERKTDATVNDKYSQERLVAGWTVLERRTSERSLPVSDEINNEVVNDPSNVDSPVHTNIIPQTALAIEKHLERNSIVSLALTPLKNILHLNDQTENNTYSGHNELEEKPLRPDELNSQHGVLPITGQRLEVTGSYSNKKTHSNRRKSDYNQNSGLKSPKNFPVGSKEYPNDVHGGLTESQSPVSAVTTSNASFAVPQISVNTDSNTRDFDVRKNVKYAEDQNVVKFASEEQLSSSGEPDTTVEEEIDEEFDIGNQYNKWMAWKNSLTCDSLDFPPPLVPIQNKGINYNVEDQEHHNKMEKQPRNTNHHLKHKKQPPGIPPPLATSTPAATRKTENNVPASMYGVNESRPLTNHHEVPVQTTRRQSQHYTDNNVNYQPLTGVDAAQVRPATTASPPVNYSIPQGNTNAHVNSSQKPSNVRQLNTLEQAKHLPIESEIMKTNLIKANEDPQLNISKSNGRDCVILESSSYISNHASQPAPSSSGMIRDEKGILIYPQNNPFPHVPHVNFPHNIDNTQQIYGNGTQPPIQALSFETPAIIYDSNVKNDSTNQVNHITPRSPTPIGVRSNSRQNTVAPLLNPSCSSGENQLPSQSKGSQTVFAQDDNGNWYETINLKKKHIEDNKEASDVYPRTSEWIAESERRSAFAHALSHIKTPTRLIGEIAFQLDRRILNYVFNTGATSKKEKRRFYSYTISNCDSKMRREAINPITGEMDPGVYGTLRMRYDYIVAGLASLGYDIAYHAEISSDLVNKYGLLPLPPNKNDSQHFKAGNLDLFDEMVTRITPDNEVNDAKILLQCLAWLARADGKPMVAW